MGKKGFNVGNKIGCILQEILMRCNPKKGRSFFFFFINIFKELVSELGSVSDFPPPYCSPNEYYCILEKS